MALDNLVQQQGSRNAGERRSEPSNLPFNTQGNSQDHHQKYPGGYPDQPERCPEWSHGQPEQPERLTGTAGKGFDREQRYAETSKEYTGKEEQDFRKRYREAQEENRSDDRYKRRQELLGKEQEEYVEKGRQGFKQRYQEAQDKERPHGERTPHIDDAKGGWHHSVQGFLDKLKGSLQQERAGPSRQPYGERHGTEASPRTPEEPPPNALSLKEERLGMVPAPKCQRPESPTQQQLSQDDETDEDSGWRSSPSWEHKERDTIERMPQAFIMPILPILPLTMNQAPAEPMQGDIILL